MVLFAFGDSWTEGVGADLSEECKTNILEEKTKIRSQFSWPKYLSELIGIEFINNGAGGCSNTTIFELISHSIKEGLIQRNDFVVIMWSSYLRDDVPYFPKGDWHLWGERYKAKKYIYDPIFSKNGNSSPLYDRALSKYREYFINNLYSDVYYNIVNQNYILFLQYMFEELGIRYLFCDAFDSLIKYNLSSDIDKTKLINRDHYWGLQKATLKDLLIKTNRKDVWEDNKLFSEEMGKHPSKVGYKIIAEELYHWIYEKNLLNYPLSQSPNIMI